MRDHEKTLHSILIASPSETFDSAVRRSLPSGRFMTVDFCRNAASARQRFFERYYDIVMINFPLPDETGAELAFDIAEQGSAGVLLAAPPEVFYEVLEQVSDYGILAVSKPVQEIQLEKAVRFLCAVQEKLQHLEQRVMEEHEKNEELRIVSKAKCLLIEKKRMTENEAHRFIGKEAMDHGLSRKRIAEKILEDYE